MINPTSTCDYHLFTQHIAVLSNYINMISLIIKDFNHLNQIISSNDLQLLYDKVMNQYDYLLVECDRCKSCHWHIHAYYKRKITIYGYLYEVSLTRVKCACCGITHVILPSFIIPYQLNSLFDLLMANKDLIKDVIRLIISKARNKLLIFLFPT